MIENKIERHIRNLSSWFTRSRRYAAENLYELIPISDSRLMINLGALPPIVRLLSDTDLDVRINALKILVEFANARSNVIPWYALAESKVLIRGLIVFAGAIPPLVNLLSSQDQTTRKYALNILSKLAENNSHTVLIAQAGAIPFLVRLMCANDSNICKEMKYDALNILSSFDDASHLASITRLIVDLGATPWLVGLLSEIDHTLRTNALTMLAELVKNTNNVGLIAEAGAIPLLDHVLGDFKILFTFDYRERKAISNALYALVKLVENAINTNNVVSINNVEAVYPAFKLLNAHDRTVRENAIYLLLMLAENVSNKAFIVERIIESVGDEIEFHVHSGNCVLLLNLLSNVNIRDADTKQSIARQVVADDSLNTALSKVAFSHALLTFAENSNNHVFIAKAKTISRFIRILRDGDKDLQRKAATTLAMIVENSTGNKKMLVGSDDMRILHQLMTKHEDGEIIQNIQKILDICQEVVKTNKKQADIVEKIIIEGETYPSMKSMHNEIRYLKQQLAGYEAQLSQLTDAVQRKKDEAYVFSAKAITQSGYFAANQGTTTASAIDSTQKEQLWGHF